MEKVLKVAMQCAATVVTKQFENVEWKGVNANFTGAASYSAKNATER